MLPSTSSLTSTSSASENVRHVDILLLIRATVAKYVVSFNTKDPAKQQPGTENWVCCGRFIRICPRRVRSRSAASFCCIENELILKFYLYTTSQQIKLMTTLWYRLLSFFLNFCSKIFAIYLILIHIAHIYQIRTGSTDCMIPSLQISVVPRPSFILCSF